MGTRLVGNVAAPPRSRASRAPSRAPPRTPAAGALHRSPPAARRPSRRRPRHAPQAPARAVASCCASRRCAAPRASSRCSRSTSPASSLAIFTALLLKEAVHGDASTVANALHGTEQFLPFAYLLTALLFATLGPVRRAGACGPGLTRIVGSLFEVALVALIFALVNGEHFSSYYLFYGSLAFAIFYVSAFRAAYDRATADAAARRRLPAPRGARRPRAADRATSPTRCADAPALRRSRSSASSRRRRCRTTGCARSARSRTSSACSAPRASTR